MKTIVEIKASEVPLVTIDPKLNRLKGVALFSKKVEKDRRTIALLGLPKLLG